MLDFILTFFGEPLSTIIDPIGQVITTGLMGLGALGVLGLLFLAFRYVYKHFPITQMETSGLALIGLYAIISIATLTLLFMTI